MSFELIISYLVVAAITGAGIVTGLLFAFSNFVMRALSELENQHGMFAMQQINEKIINPLFLLLFLGTPLLCLIIAIYCLYDINTLQKTLLLSGALLYIIGPFGITIFFNVPLNNQLAAIKPEDGNDIWKKYQVDWQRWNHIRTYIGICSIILLCIGLGFE